MPIEYTIDSTHPSLVRSRGYGTLTSDELSQHIKDLISDRKIPQSFSELCDLSDVEDLQVSSLSLRKLCRVENKNSDRLTECRLAIVAPDDFMYGMMRIYEAISHDRFTILISKTVQEAKTWLKLSESILS